MQQIEITVSVKALNPKAFVVRCEDGATTLFSYGAPVFHIAADKKQYLDGIAWGRSKSTSMHLIEFTGLNKEDMTAKLLSGEVEMARLVAPNVEAAPKKEKPEAVEAAAQQ